MYILRFMLCLIYVKFVYPYTVSDIIYNTHYQENNVTTNNSSIYTNYYLSDNGTSEEATVKPSPQPRWISQVLSEALMGYAPHSAYNSECNLHSQLYLKHLSNLTLWAVQMLDASAQSVTGVIMGNTYFMGDYDQCLGVDETTYNIKGQYCLAHLHFAPNLDVNPEYFAPPSKTYQEPSMDSSVWDKIKVTLDERIKPRDVIHWAVCVPASCDINDIQQSLTTSLVPVFQSYGISTNISLKPKLCAVSKSQPWAVGTIVFLCVMSVLIIITIAASVYETVVVVPRNHKIQSKCLCSLEKFFLTFSLLTNVRSFMGPSVDQRLDILNGIKVYTLLAIVFGHRGLYTQGLVLFNTQFWEEAHLTVGSQIVYSGIELVDVFFVISGFLTYQGVYRHLEKRKKLCLPQLVLHRWFRLVPAYLVMIVFYTTVLPKLGSGPLWEKRISLESQRCQDNWWLNLLFLNNYIHEDNQCHLMSWYLACDFHFYIVGIFVVYSVWKWPNLGKYVVAASVAISLIIPFTVTYIKREWGWLRLYLSFLQDPYSNEYFLTMYIKSHNRAGPYMIGLLSAYQCQRLIDAKYKFKSRTLLLLFIVFFSLHLLKLFGIYFYIQSHEYMPLVHATMAAFNRSLFGITFAVVVITHSTTGWLPFEIVLQSRFYTVVSRILYCIFLVHPAVQLATAASIRVPEYLSYTKMIWMSCGDIVTSYLFSLLLYFVIEAPFRTIEKYVLESSNKKRDETELNGVTRTHL